MTPTPTPNEHAEAEFVESMRRLLLDRLHRMTRFIELQAPTTLVDHAFALVVEAAIAYLGDVALRKTADRVRMRYVVSQGRCESCFNLRDGEDDTMCRACVALCEALAKEGGDEPVTE